MKITPTPKNEPKNVPNTHFWNDFRNQSHTISETTSEIKQTPFLKWLQKPVIPHVMVVSETTSEINRTPFLKRLQKRCALASEHVLETYGQTFLKRLQKSRHLHHHMYHRGKQTILLLLLLLPTFYILFRSRDYCFSICSSSLSLLTYSCVSILTLQWLSSPHNLVQHGESHDILQCDKLKGFKADSDNPISLYIDI